jgi:hypothetical protein
MIWEGSGKKHSLDNLKSSLVIYLEELMKTINISVKSSVPS